MTASLKETVGQLKSAAHPLRLRILALLDTEELCVCQVAEALQMPLSSVSESLRELKKVRFVVERRDGRWVYVSLCPFSRQATLLPAILRESTSIPEVVADKERLESIKCLPIQQVCCKAHCEEHPQTQNCHTVKNR